MTLVQFVVCVRIVDDDDDDWCLLREVSTSIHDFIEGTTEGCAICYSRTSTPNRPIKSSFFSGTDIHRRRLRLQSPRSCASITVQVGKIVRQSRLYCRFTCTSRLLSFAKQLSPVESSGSAYNGRLDDDVRNVEETLSEFSEFNKQVVSRCPTSPYTVYTAKSMELLHVCGRFLDLGLPHGTHGNFFGRQSIVF